jgi:exopolysaccharide biosynthesis polyprenyl glycosylphosphotransferase
LVRYDSVSRSIGSIGSIGSVAVRIHEGSEEVSEAGTRTPRVNYQDPDELSERGGSDSNVHHLNGDRVALATATNDSAAAANTRPNDRKRGSSRGLAAVSDGGVAATAGQWARAATTRFSVREAPTFRDAVFRRMLVLADLGAAAGGLGLVGASSRHGVGAVSLASIPLIVLLAKLGGRYDHDEVVLRKSTLDEVPALLVLAAAYALAWSLAAFVAGIKPSLGGAGVVTLWASTGALLIAGRGGARMLAQLSAPAERTIIVGGSKARAMLAHSLMADPGAHVEVVGFLPLEDERQNHSDWGPRSRRKRDLSLADMESLVRELRVQRVFLIPTSADSETMLAAVRRAAAIGVKLSIVPRLFEVVGSAVEFDMVGGVTVLGVRRPGLGRSSRIVKRTMDVIGAAVGLLFLAPFALLIALAIKLDSAGPVFFRQARVGRDGRRFQMVKFRSMVDGAEAQRAALASLNELDGIFKLSSDPRVTRVGRLLRRTSLDELPQLINVLRGEMSLVGPRPLVVDEDVLVEGRHRDRLQMPPGMTGPWQVLGHPRPPLSEMVKTDYLYAAHWSLWNDLKILLRTFSHVFAQRGT